MAMARVTKMTEGRARAAERQLGRPIDLPWHVSRLTRIGLRLVGFAVMLFAAYKLWSWYGVAAVWGWKVTR